MMLSRHLSTLARQPTSTRTALQRMVADERWQTMLRYNPIRAEHEYRWYLESRFPGRAVEVLSIAMSSRILAFDSGEFQDAVLSKMQYP